MELKTKLDRETVDQREWLKQIAGYAGKSHVSFCILHLLDNITWGAIGVNNYFYFISGIFVFLERRSRVYSDWNRCLYLHEKTTLDQQQYH